MRQASCPKHENTVMDIREKIIDTGCRMTAESLSVGTWGNISALDDEGNVYITPSGMEYSKLVPEDIVKMDIVGHIIEGKRIPSVETPLHLAVYKARSDCRAIVHTHPVYSTAFSAMGEDIPLFLDAAVQQLGDTVRTAPHAMPGSRELADNCVEALGKKSRACLLQSHGAVCIGQDLDKAYMISGLLEATAHIYSLIRSMGGSYIPLSESDTEAMRIFADRYYGQIRERH